MKILLSIFAGISLIITVFVISSLLRFSSVAIDRVVMENSYQKTATDKARTKMLNAELIGINSALSDPRITEQEKTELLQKQKSIQYQLNIGN
jgi:hypothetical protein